MDAAPRRWRHRGTWRIPFLPLVERQNKLTHLDIPQRWIGVVWTKHHTINSELNALFTEKVVFNKSTIYLLQLAENGFANTFSLCYLYLRWRPVETNDWRHPHRIRSTEYPLYLNHNLATPWLLYLIPRMVLLLSSCFAAAPADHSSTKLLVRCSFLLNSFINYFTYRLLCLPAAA